MKRYLLLYLFLGSPFLLTAQWFVGIRGGGLPTSVPISGGIGVEWVHNGSLSGLTELAYTLRENPQVTDNFPTDQEYYTAQLHYLTLPVLVRVNLPFGQSRLFLEGGPEVGRLHRANGQYTRNGLSSQIVSFQPEAVRLNSWDAGLVLGGGFGQQVGRGGLITLEFRYFLGLVDINDRRDAAMYNQGELLLLGFYLPVGKDRF